MPKLSPPRKKLLRLPLAGLQQVMAGAILRPLGPRQRMAAENEAAAAALVRPNDRLTAFERLEIYNQQYWYRLLGALGEDFPGLHAVLGQRKFERLAIAYFAERGSQSWNLRDLGQFLVPFMAEHPQLIAPHGALAIDVARVEWAKVVAFDDPEFPRFQPAEATDTSPEQLSFGLQPYVSLLALDYPIDTLLSRWKQAGSGDRRRPLRLTASRSSGPIYLAVHRLEFSVFYKRLEPAAFKIFTALRAGATLEGACALAFPKFDETAAERVQEWFAMAMRFGWLCRR